MEDNFTPIPEDTSIKIPVTFDYRGGRSANVKNKVLAVIISILVFIVAMIVVWKNPDFSLIIRFALTPVIFFILLVFNRYLVFKEIYYSDRFETQKETDKQLTTADIWGIFDIDNEHPYVTYFKNGYKGIFVKMERDTITGKSDTAQYDHYEAIGEAYNLAHSLNMDIVSVDYMASIGNDTRLEKMYQDLDSVKNENMKNMLIDIYDNLHEEMQSSYSCIDVYLFLTRDTYGSFTYNVQQVAQKMCGGNYLSYSAMNRDAIASMVVSLFNLHEFSVIKACNTIYDETVSGIKPISIYKNGEEIILNKTAEELAEERKMREQQIQDRKAEMKRRKKNKGQDKTLNNDINNEDIDLFGSDAGISNSSLEEENLITKTNTNNSNDDDIDLF